MPVFRTVLLLGLVSLGAAPLRAESSAPDEPDAAEAPIAYGDPELAPYFAVGPLKRAAAELQAGRAALALRFIPAESPEVPARWVRARALRAARNPPAARRAVGQPPVPGGA